MRFYKFFFMFVAAGILIGTSSSVEGQDSPLLRLFLGDKAPEQARRTSSSSQSKKGNLWGLGGPKRVEIDLSAQKLRAYEGNRLVMQTRISSGRRGHRTPTGHFRAGYKDADHHSSLYHNAPMPWSDQVTGNVFIHGYTVVPKYPASHGCIRVPLTGANPARRFFK